MKNIVFHNPNKLVFGRGCTQDFISDTLIQNITRVYVLTIAPLMEELKELFQPLLDSGVEIRYDVSIKEEPTFGQFESLLSQVRAFNPMGIIGIGGGSVMDVAKLLAAQQENTQSIYEIVGINNLKERQTWLACLPTTSGTGSEVSPNAILLDESDNGKKGVISPFLVPDATYIDPLLTKSVPPAVTAMTGIDAMTHCMEAYANLYSHPMVDLFALEGVRLVAENLKDAVEDGSNIVARTHLSLGSLYGGMCLGPVNTAAVHALAYPLGSLYKIPHGLSNAVMLASVMKFNIAVAPERYAKIALILGAENTGSDEAIALEGVRIIEKLISDCDIVSDLSKLGITKDSIPEMAQEAMKVQRLLKNNLRPVEIQDAVKIYENAF